ncbi:MAG: GGDEF domain-containing phosphodiesterase [bacterium]
MDKFTNNLKSNFDQDELLNVLDDFYSNNNSKNAIVLLLNKICNMCNIDKLTVISYNSDTDNYVKTQEYNQYEGFIDYMSINNIRVNDCFNLFEQPLSNEKKKFISLFNEDNYIYTNNSSIVQKATCDVGFEFLNNAIISDCYVYLASYHDLFTYYVFENHNNKSLSDYQIKLITVLCKAITNRLKTMLQKAKFENELLISQQIIQKEKLPVAVIKKEDLKVVYFNNYYKNINHDIKYGSDCHDIIKVDEHGNHSYIKKELLNINKQQWVKKCISFKLLNGQEAYMIYAKDSMDYINQINAVDNLTGVSLIAGIKEYYTSFVQRSNDKYVLCTIDIEKFKYINKNFSYDFGDMILKKLSKEIQNFIDTEEHFCRLGEDKFSIFIHYEDDVHLHMKLRKLFNNFENMKNKYFQDVNLVVVGGVTLVNKRLPFNVLLDQTTTAKKSVKGSIKNSFYYYNAEIDRKLQRDIQIEEQIPYAIANDEFTTYLQPKFNLQTKEICGAEALVRWVTPRGMIFPDQFIPLFEKNGFITTLDFIVYEKVMRYIRKCLDNNLAVYPISVNVSRNHIKDKNFIQKFMLLVRKYNIPLKYLELEITESLFVEDKNTLKFFIDEIKLQNLQISIDDFGTAYSSLQTLTDINVDILKIDKGFLDNITCTKDSLVSKDKILMKNIINLAKELDFKVVCEGVETDDQIIFLNSIGCEQGQGYVFAKPMSILDYEEQYIKLK